MVATVIPGSCTLMLDVLRLHSVTRSNHMGGFRYLMWRFMPTGKTTSIPSHYTLEPSSPWTNTAIAQINVPYQRGSNTSNTLTYYQPTKRLFPSLLFIPLLTSASCLWPSLDDTEVTFRTELTFPVSSKPAKKSSQLMAAVTYYFS